MTTIPWAHPVFSLEAAPGILVQIPPVGKTSIEYGAGYRIGESNGQVTVARARWVEPLQEDQQVDSLERDALGNGDDPEATVHAIVKATLDSILRDEAGKGDDVFLEGSIRLRSDIMDRVVQPERIVATVADAIREWYEMLPFEVLLGELGLKGLPPATLDFELLLPASVVQDSQVMSNLAALEGRFTGSYVDAVGTSTASPSDMIPELPSLVALPLGQIEARRALHHRFLATYYTFEAAVRYLASLALVPLLGESRRERLEQAFAAAGGNSAPTVGWYLGVVRERADDLVSLAPATAAALATKKGRRSDLGRFVGSRLPELRNDYLGHGGIRADSEYVKPLEELSANLPDLLKKLAEDSKALVPVVRTHVDFSPEAEFDYDLTLLMGSGVPFTRRRTISTQRIDGASVYLWHLKDDSFTLADPFIRYGECPRCGYDEAFFLDHFEPRKPEWVSLRGGHRLTL